MQDKKNYIRKRMVIRMVDYNLDSDEVVIVECEDIQSDSRERGNLVLTNKNIIWASKNIFGKIKQITKRNINDIKIYEGRAQAKLENGKLLIYFKNEQFAYYIYSRSKGKEIVNNINKILLDVNLNVDSRKALPGTEAIAGTIKSTLNVFKESLGKNKMISKKCESCGASLSGKKGETDKCPYCDSYITFE